MAAAGNRSHCNPHDLATKQAFPEFRQRLFDGVEESLSGLAVLGFAFNFGDFVQKGRFIGFSQRQNSCRFATV